VYENKKGLEFAMDQARAPKEVNSRTKTDARPVGDKKPPSLYEFEAKDKIGERTRPCVGGKKNRKFESSGREESRPIDRLKKMNANA